jgi:hypothetical protein
VPTSVRYVGRRDRLFVTFASLLTQRVGSDLRDVGVLLLEDLSPIKGSLEQLLLGTIKVQGGSATSLLKVVLDDIVPNRTDSIDTILSLHKYWVKSTVDVSGNVMNLPNCECLAISRYDNTC